MVEGFVVDIVVVDIVVVVCGIMLLLCMLWRSGCLIARMSGVACLRLMMMIAG